MGVSTATMTELKVLLETMVKGVVDAPEEVEVNVVPAASTLVAELHTSQKDVSYVVGKRGRVADAIRVILESFGGRYSLKVSLDYVTDNQSKVGSRSFEERDHT